MKTIFKYRLEITDEQTIDIPAFGRILSVGLDPAGDLCLWALVMSDNETEPRKIYVVGTGNPMLTVPTKNFIGSVTQGPFVWHVFGG